MAAFSLPEHPQEDAPEGKSTRFNHTDLNAGKGPHSTYTDHDYPVGSAFFSCNRPHSHTVIYY